MAILVLVTMVRGLLMLSQRLKLMLVFSMEPMAMVVMDLDMAVLAMLVLATMARGLPMLSQRPMLVCTMVDLDMDIPVLDILDMVVMDLDMEDTVLVMDVPSMVKQLIYASKSSKVILLLFSALMWGRNFVFYVQTK